MAGVTFTQDQIDAFKTAMLKNPGVLEIRFGDQLYKFATLKDRADHLAYMQRNLAGTDPVRSGSVRYAQTSKGF
jgi:hypothetical protein